MWANADSIFNWDTNADPDTITGLYQAYPVWTSDKKKTSFKTGAYFQLKTYFFNRITGTVGLRFDHFDLNGKSYLSPRIGLTLVVTEKSSLNFSYGIHNQMPTFTEIYNHPENVNLKNKQTYQIAGSFEHIFRNDTKGTIEIFYKTYRDVPIPYSWITPDPFDSYEGLMVNKGKGYGKGIELFLQKKLSGNFQFTISYAHAISMAYDYRVNNYYNWDYDYRNIVTLIGGYRATLINKEWYQKLSSSLLFKIFGWIIPLGDETLISFRWRYLGGRPFTTPDYLKNLHYWVVQPTTSFNTSRYPYYQRLDLRLDRRYFFKNWNLVTYFDIMNVFNRDNIWDYNYSSDGTIENIYQFKTMPVGGITIEF